MMRTGGSVQVYVGTSGYNYPEWRGTFYPDRLPAAAMFGYYAQRFRSVEINYTFYRMPTPKTTAAWLAQAPAGFRYTLKAPRRITHDRRLRDAGDLVGAFCDSAAVLGPHLGALLFQLPPGFRADAGRLEAFLAGLPPGVRAAVEFRHDSWYADEIVALLERYGAALCIADAGGRSAPVRATARHGYFRLRDEGYQPADLERWAAEIAARRADWDEVFVYFKHEGEGKGPAFARAFVDALGRAGVTA